MISKDKVLHLIAGIFISVVSFYLIFFSIDSLQYATIASIILYISAGIGKELYDSFFPTKHTVDAWDAVWTIIGGSLSTIVILVLIRLF